MSYAFESEDEQYEFANEDESESVWEFANESYEDEGESEIYALESELAAELLEINTEEELDQFLGKLARGVFRGASKFIKSPIGRALGGVLKNVAKTALPAVGGALGNLVLPGVGGAIGSKLGSVAGGLLEAGEAEMMGEEEAQMEAARRYVRFARASYRNAARTPRSVPPRAAARAATLSAARMYAPSLVRGGRRSSPWRARRRPAPRRPGAGRQDIWTDSTPGDPYADGDPDFQGGTEGRWVRRGNKVVLYGI